MEGICLIERQVSFLLVSKELLDAIASYEDYYSKNGTDEALVDAYLKASRRALQIELDREYGLGVSKRCKEIMDEYINVNTKGMDFFMLEKYAKENNKNYEIVNQYYEVLLLEARKQVLDSYLLYLEKNRDIEDRFYQPRRKLLLKHGFIDALQELIDGKIEILSISTVPGSGKTTLGEMFMSGWLGWHPDLCNLFSSHSGHVTRMVYEVMCNIIGASVKEGKIPEYTWREIFPNVELENVNAKEQEINLGKFKPFKTLTCRALGASQTGVTRCEGILYCDDLCSGIEMALSKMRLDKLWTMYSTDLKTRKKKGKNGITCAELHISTRWSVWDVIGRLKTIYSGNKRCKFLSIPDIDPETGESNFDYDYGVGFDVSYFEDIQKSLDEITYKCLYKNEPVEREGILYAPDTLRRYGELPPRQADAILAFCDTKDTGTDYNCLGVFYKYDKDYYLADVVFRNIDPAMLDELNADCLVRHNVHIAQFESNKEGSRTADKIQEKVKAKGGNTSIQKKYSTQNKETKIIVNSPWVLEHVLFPFAESAEYPDGYAPNSEMGQFMSYLCSYSQLSKNTHDDAPDMISMLAVNENTYNAVNTIEACFNPFRGGW